MKKIICSLLLLMLAPWATAQQSSPEALFKQWDKNKDGKPFSRGFTPQEHVFLDNETVLAVDRANKAKLGGRENMNNALNTAMRRRKILKYYFRTKKQIVCNDLRL